VFFCSEVADDGVSIVSGEVAVPIHVLATRLLQFCPQGPPLSVPYILIVSKLNSTLNVPSPRVSSLAHLRICGRCQGAIHVRSGNALIAHVAIKRGCDSVGGIKYSASEAHWTVNAM